MNNEENNKKTWQTPEIVDLDAKTTEYLGAYGTDGASPQPTS